MEFDGSVFWAALLSYDFARGAVITVTLAFVAHALAIVISVPMAVTLVSGGALRQRFIGAYIGLFRAIPTLLLLLFVWNAIPQFFPIFRHAWFTPFLAAWIALALNEAAYQVEINRAALLAVDPGQTAAGQALGLKPADVRRYVVFPQAFRIALAPTVNEFITLLKITSLASVISLQELMTVTQINVARSFQFTEHYTAALVYYLAMVYGLMFIQKRIERRFAWADRSTAASLSQAGRR